MKNLEVVVLGIECEWYLYLGCPERGLELAPLVLGTLSINKRACLSLDLVSESAILWSPAVGIWETAKTGRFGCTLNLTCQSATRAQAERVT